MRRIFKNVIWSENKIYKQSLWKGTAYSFAGNNSSTTNYLLTYDRDNASCTATSDRDTINIFMTLHMNNNNKDKLRERNVLL